MLLQGNWFEIAHIAATAVVGVYLLSCAVQGWFVGRAGAAVRLALAVGGFRMIAGGWFTDAIGLGIAVLFYVLQKRIVTPETLAHGAD